MKNYISILLLTVFLSSCSLLKFSIDTGDQPLSPTDVNTRIVVRGFYDDFVSQISIAADSIAKSTKDQQIRLRAIKWKIDATSLCASAALNSVPEVALVNTWSMCNRMNITMHSTPALDLFGEQTHIALHTTGALLQKIQKLAQKLLPAAKYSKMSEFVAQNAKTKQSEDLTLPWISFIGANDTTFVKTTGTMAQNIAELNNKFSAYTSQYANELSWSKDLFMAKYENDSLQQNIKMQLDSISVNFSKMTIMLENSPQMAEQIAQKLNTQIAQLMLTLDRSVDSAFENISTERVALQEFVDGQRAELMLETQAAAELAIDTFMAKLPATLGKIIIFVVIGLVVLLSLPFVIGYFLGKTIQKRKEDKV